MACLLVSCFLPFVVVWWTFAGGLGFMIDLAVMEFRCFRCLELGMVLGLRACGLGG